jgi:peptidoglycan/xylan/chitin deacetylase (PgdA/CDA1 family)
MKVISSWDDAGVGDLRLAELMENYNIPTVFNWPVNLEKSKNVGRVGKFLTLEQCKEIAKVHEVGSHTLTHQWLTKINTKQARNEIFESRKFWQDETGQEVKSLCYPRGYTNALVIILVKNAGYESARTTAVGNLGVIEDPFKTPTTVHIGIDRIEYKGQTWEVYARKMLSEATEDSVYHMMGHSWELDRENDWDALETLLKELT